MTIIIIIKGYNQTVHTSNFIFPSAPCTSGDLSILDYSAGITNKGEGVIRICLNDTQGTICDEGWSYESASVACKSLGYSQFGRKYLKLRSLNFSVL